MAASGTGSLIFIDDVRNASNFIGRHFTLQQNNSQKYTENATIRWGNWKFFSSDLNPIEKDFIC